MAPGIPEIDPVLLEAARPDAAERREDAGQHDLRCRDFAVTCVGGFAQIVVQATQPPFAVPPPEIAWLVRNLSGEAPEQCDPTLETDERIFGGDLEGGGEVRRRDGGEL